jgi:hypothetical protein
MKKYIVIREQESGDEVERMDVSEKSERAIDRIEMGVLRQTDLDRFTVGVEES